MVLRTGLESLEPQHRHLVDIIRIPFNSLPPKKTFGEPSIPLESVSLFLLAEESSTGRITPLIATCIGDSLMLPPVEDSVAQIDSLT